MVACPYCGTPTGVGVAAETCAACGAPIDVAPRASSSGWLELPAARDMARIQCGHSSVQIEGKIVPVADFALAGGEGVYFAHHELLWKEPQVTVTRRGLAGAWKRLLAGLPIHMLEAAGPGRIAFSRDAPGETLAIPLHPGAVVDVREHLFMVATHSVAYDWFSPGIWFQTGSGDERETHYPVGSLMDRFTAPAAPGLLLIHAHGNAFLRRLAPGERILVKPSGLLYKDATVTMHLHIERPAARARSLWTWGERYMWLALTGPGRVAVQSAYGHTHDPGTGITGSSPMSEQRW
ncbi:MAG TPA: AIM24 family protein [Polyangiaceae bacterium]